ncbi:sensor histidine kinase [Sporosarcina sp. FA9]|uniref:sensor histidine kinase n=1 Tax=Sporosarcina sp. FA9 TaxID=3413030 RepID=UPI003F6562D2
MIIMVPLAGEVKFYPLNDTFRVSFGAPAIFFFLLLLKKVPPVFPGFLTATAVVLFRVLMDLVFKIETDVFFSFQQHFPTFFFYFTFACLFQLINIQRFRKSSLMIGFIGYIVELLSDSLELFVQYITLNTTITMVDVIEMNLVAFAHSFIVVSFFNMLKLYEADSREKQIREKNEHMLVLISNLHEEAVYLKKTLKNAETVTVQCYDLYRDLVGKDKEDGLRALRIAGEIHEIKKDNQRIFAGLSKLISKESFKDYLMVEDLIRLIVRINEKYVFSLNKRIKITYLIEGNHPDYHGYTVLSLINNLIANAVEAVPEEGNIHVSFSEADGIVKFDVFNSGSSIPDKYAEAIFQPGFTSRYDVLGNPSTGIGLSYVKEAVNNLNGKISFKSQHNSITFSITIPVNQLTQKG